MGGSAPAAQRVSVTSSGSALSFTAAVDSSATNWLSATPLSGVTSSNLSVSVIPGSLIPGTYTANITVTAGAASNSPQTVAVTLTVSSNSTLSLSPAGLSFTYQSGGSVPAAKTVSVSTGSSLVFNATAATNTGGSWLAVNPQSGATPGTLTVSVSPAALAPGAYTGNISVSAPGANNTPQSIAVTLTVNSAPAITLNPTQVAFAFQTGGTAPKPQTVAVAAASPVPFSAALSDSSWLAVTPAGGTTPGTLTLTVNAANLSAGTYTDLVTVTPGGVNNPPQTVAVTLTVTNPPTITTSSSQLGFSYQIGGPVPQAQTVIVFTGSSLPFTAAASGGTWLTVTPAKGTTPATIEVGINLTDLAAGAYTGTVTITCAGASNSPLAIPVTLTVTGTLNLSVAPTPLNFTFITGGTAPAAQNLTVSAPEPVSFTAAATGGSWLSITPTSGTSPGTIAVSVTTAKLTPGTNNGTITITSAAAANSPITVPVTLMVSAPPAITATPAQLSFTCQTGGAAPPAQTVAVSAASATPFAATAGGGTWLSVSPATGTTPGSLSVSVNPSGLAAGTYNANVAIAPSGSSTGTPQTVPVTLTVTAAPTVSVSPAQVTFQYETGGAIPQSQILTVSAAATTAFTTSVTGGSWLSVTPASGSAPGSITASVNPGSLATGSYTANIVLTPSGTGSVPQTVPVTLTVSPPAITVAPAQVSFAYQIGGVTPQAQILTVSAATTTSFSAAAKGAAWLALSPANGSAPGSLTVSVNPGSLAAGTYNASITVTPAGSSATPRTVSVTLTVAAASTLSITPAQLALSAQSGAATVPSQTLALSAGSAMSFTAAVTGGSWLSVSPASGTTPATLTVTANPAGMAPGTYNASVAVSGGSSQMAVKVTFTITGAALSGPAISAVVNAASFQSGPVAPGEIITIGGTGLGPSVGAGLALDKNGKVATTLAGVQVLVNGTAAPLTYVSATQINAVVPYELKLGAAAGVQVSYSGQTSAAFPLSTGNAAPAFFTANGSGLGQVAAFNSDQVTLNSPDHPAPRGSIVVLYMTGEGQTTPSGVTGQVTTVSATPPLTPKPTLPVSVLINGQPCSVLFYGEAPNLISGVMQLNVQIPDGVPAASLPLQVTVGGVSSPGGITVSVQ